MAVSPTVSGAIASVIPEALYFPEPHDRLIENHLRVHAAPGKYLVFGIKSTTPARYVVKPRYGIVKPGGFTAVLVALRENAAEIEASAASPPTGGGAPRGTRTELKDRFQLEVREVDAVKYEKELSKLLLSAQHGGRDEQERIKELFRACEGTAQVSRTLPCHFYGIVVNGGPGAVTMPTEAIVIAKPTERDPEKLTSAIHGPPADSASPKAPATEAKPARPTAPPTTAEQPRAMSGSEIAAAVEAKRRERDELSVRLAGLEERLEALRRDTNDVIAATAKTADLLNRYKAAGKHGAAGRIVTTTAKLKIPSSVIIIATLLTFVITLWLRGSIITSDAWHTPDQR